LFHTYDSALPPESQKWLDETEYASSNLKDLTARVVIDGEEYQPVCTCKVPPANSAISCYPQQITITRQDPLPGQLQPGRLVLDGLNLRILIGDPADLRIVEVEKSAFHDVDGRSSEEALRVWGGEAGELLLALAVWDDMTVVSTGTPLRYTSVKRAVHSWIKYQNSQNARKFFYISTDTDALAYVESTLSGRLNDDDGLDVTVPPEELQDDVLKGLITPNGTGCPHLKAILTAPEKYGIRSQLVEEFLTHIWRLMWDTNEPLRKRMKLYVHHAPHVGDADDKEGIHIPREAAWINVISDDVCWKEKKVALFPPWSDDVSIFVSQPQAVTELHASAARFVKGMMGGAAATTEILPKIQEKYDAWDMRTKETLSTTQGIPVFEVKIGVVEEKNVVEEEASGGGAGGGVDINMLRQVPLENE
jgi:hypothetical protein